MFARVLTFEFRPEPIVEAQMEKSSVQQQQDEQKNIKNG